LSILLDTNVLSEARRPEPDRNVLAWLDRLDGDRAFVSVVSLAEIRRGVALMENGRRRDALSEWLARDLPERFAGRILAIGQEAAFAWGDLMAAAKRRGIGLTSMDGLLAATASAHSLILATRNTRDFRDLGVKLFDPWGA
jgi:predicted nucleic acid-binding protein